MSEHLQVEVLGVDALAHHDGQARPYVVLRDSRMRQLTLLLGECEAAAIGSVVDGRLIERPSIHDTTLRMIQVAGARLQRVTITEVLDEVYYAVAELRVGASTEEISLRPADAVALALRAHCPIYVAEHVIVASAHEVIA